MGAVTVAVTKRDYEGSSKVVYANVTFSGSYGAGGDTYTNAQFEMMYVHAIMPLGPAAGSTTTGYGVMPDLPNKKLRLIGGAASGVAGAETGTAGQTGTVAAVKVYGDNPY
jgi:hypothetical protein